MNPTVSETRIVRPPFSRQGFVLVSSVEKSRSWARTSALVKAFISVDLPAFVYPTRAIVN